MSASPEKQGSGMSMVQLALRRPYTFIVMAMLIVLSTPFVLRNMAVDIFPEIDIPVITIIWQYNGLNAPEVGERHAGQRPRGTAHAVRAMWAIATPSLRRHT